jgi:hypothetical protein
VNNKILMPREDGKMMCWNIVLNQNESIDMKKSMLMWDLSNVTIKFRD